MFQQSFIITHTKLKPTEMASVENPEKGLPLFKNDTSLSKSIELVFTTEEVNFFHGLLSQLNKKSAIQKMEGYIHLVKLMNKMDEVLEKTSPVYSTVNTLTMEVGKP